MIVVDSHVVQMQLGQLVPLRDGVTLSADIYRPWTTDGRVEPHPVILTRTPYVKARVSVYETALYFVRQGYTFVAMDVRGRGDSAGSFVPYFNEGKDGYDAIEWCAHQPWCDGNVGTIGASYDGRIQWLAAVERPPHLRTMIVLVPPSDPFVETPTGLPAPQHLCWLHYVSGRVVQPMEIIDWERAYKHLPMFTMDEQIGRYFPTWRGEIAQHAQLDAYWEPLRYQTRFAQVEIPVLHISGWYDDEQVGTPLNYIGMTQHAATPIAREQQRLLMGPWGHASNKTAQLGAVDFGPQALIDLRGEQSRWYDRWLKNAEPSDQADVPVRIFIMGSNTWRDESEWPLARTQYTSYYLQSTGQARSLNGDGTLATQPSTSALSFDHYSYDPANPVPFITEATSSQIGGPDDYTEVQTREDVLVYVTDPLSADLEVTGPVRVELYASSSASDTDFMAMLIDIWPDGYRQRLCDGMVRARFREGMADPTLIEAGQIYRYSIDCWNTAQVFKTGHRICVQIASSAFPKYDRNLNTGAPLGMTSEMIVAEQRIYHDEGHPSAIILPVIPA